MNRWSESLNDLLVPHIFKGINKIYNDIKRASMTRGNTRGVGGAGGAGGGAGAGGAGGGAGAGGAGGGAGAGGGVIKPFQLTLMEIKYLPEALLEEDYNQLLYYLKNNDMSEKLLTSLLSKIYINMAQTELGPNETVKISIPKNRVFVHKVYINAANIFFKEPLLFYHKYEPTIIQQNYLVILEKIKNAISKTINNDINNYIAIGHESNCESEPQIITKTDRLNDIKKSFKTPKNLLDDDDEEEDGFDEDEGNDEGNAKYTNIRNADDHSDANIQQTLTEPIYDSCEEEHINSTKSMSVLQNNYADNKTNHADNKTNYEDNKTNYEDNKTNYEDNKTNYADNKSNIELTQYNLDFLENSDNTCASIISNKTYKNNVNNKETAIINENYDDDDNEEIEIYDMPVLPSNKYDQSQIQSQVQSQVQSQDHVDTNCINNLIDNCAYDLESTISVAQKNIRYMVNKPKGYNRSLKTLSQPDMCQTSTISMPVTKKASLINNNEIDIISLYNNESIKHRPDIIIDQFANETADADANADADAEDYEISLPLTILAPPSSPTSSPSTSPLQASISPLQASISPLQASTSPLLSPHLDNDISPILRPQIENLVEPITQDISLHEKQKDMSHIINKKSPNIVNSKPKITKVSIKLDKMRPAERNKTIRSILGSKSTISDNDSTLESIITSYSNSANKKSALR